MKRIVCLILVSMLLSGCSYITGVFEALHDSLSKEGEINNQLIDQKNPLDERKVIETAMEKQKEILKPGFITDDYRIGHMGINYYLPEGDLYYSASYGSYGNLIMMFYDRQPVSNKEIFNSMNENFEVDKEIEHDELKGFYGVRNTDWDSDHYEMRALHDDVSYNITVAAEEETDNLEIMERMTESLKTEADGAYDPLYNRITIDLDQVKFPTLSEDYTNVESVRIGFWDSSEAYMELEVSYELKGLGYIHFTVVDKEVNIPEDYYDLEGEKETAAKTTVTEYKDKDNDTFLFTWTDEVYHYKILFWPHDGSFDRQDIYDIIDSSIQDQRKFANKEAFEGLRNEPNFNQTEKELEKLLKD